MWWNFLPGCLRFLPDVHALGDAPLHDRGDLGSGLPHRLAARQEPTGKGSSIDLSNYCLFHLVVFDPISFSGPKGLRRHPRHNRPDRRQMGGEGAEGEISGELKLG